MVLLSFVLQHLHSGAQLIVIGHFEPDGSENISAKNIRQLFLVMGSGKQEPLPVSLFPQLYPHLVEVERNQQRVVYSLQAPQ